MGYKIKGALKKSKWVFIIFGILWVILSIVLSTCITVSKVEAEGLEGVATAGNIIESFLNHIGDIGGNLSKSFTSEYISTFWKVELRLTVVLFICVIID